MINEDDIVDKYVYEQFDLLNEMAQIGYVGPYQVYVHTNDPGNIPHFHMWDLTTRGDKFHTCIRIDRPEYFHHTGKEDTLNSKLKKQLMNFLNELDEDSGFTNWKWLVLEWNRNNSLHKVPIDTELPDYTKL